MYLKYNKVISAAPEAAIPAISTGFLSVLKPDVFHTYLQNFQPAKTCDIHLFVKKGNLSFTAII